MPEIKKHMAANGFADALSGTNQHVEQSWIETFAKAKDVYALDPETIPNTYLKYYLYPRHVVEKSDPNYTRANEVMDGKEKDTYNMMKEVIKLGALKGTKYELDPNRGVHATYIVDLATSIANNTNDIFLIITKNRGCIPNLDSEMMVEVACRGWGKWC